MAKVRSVLIHITPMKRGSAHIIAQKSLPLPNIDSELKVRNNLQIFFLSASHIFCCKNQKAQKVQLFYSMSDTSLEGTCRHVSCFFLSEHVNG